MMEKEERILWKIFSIGNILLILGLGLFAISFLIKSEIMIGGYIIHLLRFAWVSTICGILGIIVFILSKLTRSKR